MYIKCYLAIRADNTGGRLCKVDDALPKQWQAHPRKDDLLREVASTKVQ